MLHGDRLRAGVALVLLGLLSLGLGGCELLIPPAPEVGPASTELLEKSVRFLASDQLEGRGLGTRGLDLAAQYVAGYFRGLGLQPPPRQQSYLQEFSSTLTTGLDPRSSLTLGKQPGMLGVNFAPLSVSGEGSFDGTIVFVGYGETFAASGAAPGSDSGGYALPPGTQPDAHSLEYDDYTGVDVRGRVALAMRFGPHDPEGHNRFGLPWWPETSCLLRKARAAAARGAVALLVVHPPMFHGEESFRAATHQAAEVAPIPVIQITQRLADTLLLQSGASDLKTFQQSIDKALAPRSFVLSGLGARGRVLFRRETYAVRNVAGLLPGRGPRAGQYIVIGAHYDHLGYGPAGSLDPSGGRLHPGADDNASGVAAMLELARMFSQAGPCPRSLLFIAFTGEERGLLGSRHWVENPPVPLDRIVAMVNLDMVGRVRNGVLMVGGFETSPAFSPILQQADDRSPLVLRHVRNAGAAPSDNAPFVRRGIPVIFFTSGIHADYHRPSDTPDRIHYLGQAKAVELAADVIRQLLAAPALPFVRTPASGSASRFSPDSLQQ